MGFGTFLTGVEHGLVVVGQDVEKRVAATGPIIPAIVSGIAGPQAGAVASTLVNFVIAAEKRHQLKIAAPGSTNLPVDTRKAEVIDDIKNATPLVEAALAMTGHPVPNPAAFDQFVSAAIDAVVQDLNAYAAFQLAFPGDVVVKAA